MQSRRKLRFRLVLSFALFGFGLSALFAVASLYVRAKVEDQLVVSALQHDVDQAVDQIIAHPDQQSHSELLEDWFKSDRTLYKMPLAWQNLGTGVHNITETDVNGIVRQLEAYGESDIPSKQIGELVMDTLKELDPVAYVRFASVYRNFREAKDFEDFVGSLGENA